MQPIVAQRSICPRLGRMAKRSFDVIVLGAGPAGEVAPGGWPRPATTSRSSRSTSSAASAPSTRACRPRRCCAGRGARRGRADPRRGPAVTGSTSRPCCARRDEVVHDLRTRQPDPVARAEGHRAGPRPRPDRRRAHRARRRRRARRAAGRRDVDRQLRRVPPIRDGIEARPWWTNREATTAKAAPEPAARPRRRAGVGCEMAQAWSALGRRGDARRGRPPCSSSREEPFAGDRRCRTRSSGAGRRRPHGQQSASGVSRAATCAVKLDDGRSASGAELLLALGRRAGDGRAWGSRPSGSSPGQAIEVDHHLQRGRGTLALRDRRCQRPRASHAHGQVQRGEKPT